MRLHLRVSQCEMEYSWRRQNSRNSWCLQRRVVICLKGASNVSHGIDTHIILWIWILNSNYVSLKMSTRSLIFKVRVRNTGWTIFVEWNINGEYNKHFVLLMKQSAKFQFYDFGPTRSSINTVFISISELLATLCDSDETSASTITISICNYIALMY